MPATRRIARLHILAAAGTIALSCLGVQQAQAQQRKPLRWATSSIDSYGYKVAASMTKIIEDALGGEYAVTVNPYPSTTASVKAVLNGEGEFGHTADVGMAQLYAGEGGFKDMPMPKGKMVHTWYAYPIESFMAVPTKDIGKYKCLRDLSGKPAFFSPAGFMNWLNFQRIYKTLGYDFKHVQIDAKSNADALQAGTIAGSVAYTVSGRSLAPYWKETEVRMDVSVVNPCADEVEKLKAAGLTINLVEPKNAFSKDVGVKEIMGVPILMAYHVMDEFPEEAIYKILKALYENRDKLASIDPGFQVLAKDFAGLQAAGIDANPQIAVHAGLARFLKEQKVWNDKWTIAKGN